MRTIMMMKMKSFVSLPLSLLVLLVVVTAKESKVLVHIPFPLHNATGFDHVRAEFGFDVVSAGRSLGEYVYYIEETLCVPVTNQSTGYPTHDSAWKTPFILLINGGGVCSAVTKVRHAQQIGASAVLLAAPHCMCADAACIQTYPNDTCEHTDPVLVNDGSAADISIPSFYIFKLLGDALKHELKTKNAPCLVELQWGLLQDDDDIRHSPPKFHFWTTAYDPLVRLETYVDIRTVVTAFNDVAVFAPRYALIDGTRFHCQGTAEPDAANAPCDHLCTNHGRYCTLHSVDLSGSAIVKETLRRLCVWKHFSYNANMYWDYVIYHKQECSQDPNKFGDSKCIDEAMRVAKIDAATVNHCMSDAGNLDQDVTNALLDEAVLDQSRSGVVALPALTVNRKLLPHTSARALFDTVCTEYWLSGIDTIPAVCETCAACPNPIGCLKAGHCVAFSNEQRHPETGFSNKNKKGGHHHGWKVFWSLTVVVAVAGAVWYYYDQRGAFRPSGGGGGGRGGSMGDYLHLSGED